VRTITDGLTATQITGVQVVVSHPTLGDVNLCSPSGSSFPGKSRLLAVSMVYSHDTGAWTATLTLANHAPFRDAGESLDPGHTSDFNPSGIPLLGGYNRVKIKIGKGGNTPATVFDGYVGPGNTRGTEDVNGDDTLDVDVVGILQPYADYYIDIREGRVYSDTYISAATNCLNQILTDYGFAPVIEVEDDPLYYVYKYEIGDVSLLEAIQRPVNAIGYVLAEKYHAGSGDFRPTIVDPDRSNVTPDLTIGGNIRLFRTDYTEANVRTAVRVVYRERSTGKEAVVDAANEAARLIYGVPDGTGRKHRYMRIVEKAGSLIDTRAEAVKLADYALHDLSSPCPNAEAHIPWLCLGFEGGELVTIDTPSETVTLGVTGITMTIGQGDTVGSTVLRGALYKRIGARRYWFSRARTDWLGKHDRDRDERTGPIPEPPSNPEARGVWGEGVSGDSAPVLHVRWAGTRSWNISGYLVRYREGTLVDYGTATGGSSNTVEDTDKAWTPGALAGHYLWLTAPARNAVCRRILSNTATILTIDPVDDAITNGETYEILRATGDWTYVATDIYPYVQIEGLSEGKRMICEIASVPVSTRR